ncbi:MAG: hypothetical protein ACRC7R_10755 [Sarcina sp.]
MMQDISGNKTYWTVSTNNGYVQVKNMGGFVANFEVSYTTKYGVEYFSSDNIPISNIKKMDIPEGATKIYVKVNIFNSGGSAIPVYNNILNNNSSVVDLELHGSMWNPYYHIIKETEPTIAVINFINYGLFVTNSIIAYYVDGVRYRLDLGNFYLGMSRSLNLPNKAKTITVYAQINVNALANWYTVYSKIFEEAKNITITMSGTVWYPYAEEKIQPSNVNVPIVSAPNPITTPNDSIKLKILDNYTSFMKSKHDEFMENM